MRNASAALIAYLNSLDPTIQPNIADLITIIQTDGTITRLTSAAVNVLSISQAIAQNDPTIYTFVSGGVTFSRGTAKLVVGLQVDDMPLALMTDPDTQLLGGIPWPAAARNGALDGARMVIERVFMPTWGDTSAGTIIMFAGTAGQIQANRNSIALSIQADINVLGRPMPRNLYQPGCLHNLYDGGCTLNQATFTDTGTVGSGSTTRSINTNLTEADFYYELGAIEFTSGPLNGVFRTVKTYLNSGGVVGVAPPLPSAPTNGITFEIYPGCDKMQATCSGKFANLAHFKGMPYVPVPESGA